MSSRYRFFLSSGKGDGRGEWVAAENVYSRKLTSFSLVFIVNKQKKSAPELHSCSITVTRHSQIVTYSVFKTV